MYKEDILKLEIGTHSITDGIYANRLIIKLKKGCIKKKEYIIETQFGSKFHIFFMKDEPMTTVSNCSGIFVHGELNLRDFKIIK